MDFTPIGGRIIKVSDKDYEKMFNFSSNLYTENLDEEGLSRKL